MKYFNNFIIFPISALALTLSFAVAYAEEIPTQDNGTTAEASPAPSPSSSPSASPVSAPAVQDNNAPAENNVKHDTANTSNTSGGGGGGGSSGGGAYYVTTTVTTGIPDPISDTNDIDDAQATTTILTATTTAVIATSTLPLLASTTQCNYLSGYMKAGLNNPTDQVVLLQTFLKDTENMDVSVTGFFDQKTVNAVRIFQAKYAADVLVPWGLKHPTGAVYHTTSKKINEIYCKKSFSLTLAQIREIESYRNVVKKVAVSRPPLSASVVDVDKAVDNAGEIEGVATESFSSRLWDFTKSLLGF
ncbi:MAG: peptidoglycan-binding domain-containing protein [bacterium]|nr:peptidoglycan-binding domain-containing protein [bacterium]